MIKTLKMELAKEKEKVKEENVHSWNNQGMDRSYAHAAASGREEMARRPMQSRTCTFEQISRSQQHSFSEKELVDVYFYMNLVGNLGLIRRTLVQEVFHGREP